MEAKKIDQPKNQNHLIDLDKIRSILNHNPRDLLLFNLLVDSEMTVPQVLSLRVAGLRNLHAGDSFSVPQSGASDKPERVELSQHTAISLQSWLTHSRLEDSDYLFRSRKGSKPLSVTSVSRLVNGWLKDAGLVNYNGLRDLRKAPKLEPTSKEQNELVYKKQSIEMLPQIKEQSIQRTVYQELQNAIVSGHIIPGQRLITDDIAHQMGVSRSPVREAIGRLEARGFITTKPNWGSVVNELSRANLEEILEIRLTLECQAAIKAVARVTDHTIHNLLEAHEAYAAARRGNNADSLLKYNRIFHMLIYQNAKSPVLLDIIEQLWDRVSPYYHILFRQSIRPQPTAGVSYHDRIVAAMREHDTEQTCFWLREDLVKSSEYIMELFDTQSV